MSSISRYNTEKWFREQGLPLFVPLRQRAKYVVARALPALSFITFFIFFLTPGLYLASLFKQIFYEKNNTGQLVSPDEDTQSIYDGIFEGAFWVAVILACFCAWLINKCYKEKMTKRTILSVVFIILFVCGIPIYLNFFSQLNNNEPLIEGLNSKNLYLENLLIVLVILLLTALGLGSFISWAFKNAVSQLGTVRPLTSIALPLLMVVLLFSFYSQEIWQMVSNLPQGRLLWINVFLLLTGTFFVVYGARREIRFVSRNLTHAEKIDYAKSARLKRDSKTVDLIVEDPPNFNTQASYKDPYKKDTDNSGDGDDIEISKSQHFNILLVLVMAQAFQALIFGGIVWIFFIILSKLSIEPATIKQWTGKDPVPFVILGEGLPGLDQASVRVSAFLAAVASLNFVFSMSDSKTYREVFLIPLLDQIKRALAVQSLYKIATFDKYDGADRNNKHDSLENYFTKAEELTQRADSINEKLRKKSRADVIENSLKQSVSPFEDISDSSGSQKIFRDNNFDGDAQDVVEEKTKDSSEQ